MRLKELLINNGIARLIIRIYNHFDTVPSSVALKDYRFYIISNIGYTLSWIIHSLWLFTFLWLGLYTMMAIQFFSIGVHVLAIVINRKGGHMAAMMVGMPEVIGHQLLAATLLGWGAGFQYIIPAVALFPFLKHDAHLSLKLLLVLCCLSAFLYIEIFEKSKPPVYHLSDMVMKGFNYSNIFFCFGLMSIWGFSITNAIHRSEAILIEKNKALFAAEKTAERAELQRQLEVKDKDAEIHRLLNVELKKSHDEILLRNRIIENEKKRSDDLLLNILPSEVAEELKNKGSAAAKHYDTVTVMFTDFVSFSTISEQMSPQQLIDELHTCFKAFDEIIGEYNIEKIKTIGDAYLAVAGMPSEDPRHAIKILNAAMAIKTFMADRKKQMGDRTFEVRIGIHSGSVVAGIVGVKKFSYDIWGDTVNIAARMEQNSQPGQVNISQTTYELIKGYFECEYRGKINAKNKGDMDMYFVQKKITAAC